MVEFVTDMPYLKQLAGIVITRSLLIPVIRGSYVVVTTTLWLMLVRSTRTTTVVVRTSTARFAWFCQLLERSELIQRSLYVDTFIVFKKSS